MGRRAWMFLALALTVAGCLNAAPQGGDQRGPGLLVFLPEIQLANAHGAEPNFASLPGGTLFMVATPISRSTADPDFRNVSCWLWRSTDHGESWTTLRRPNPVPTPAGDATIHGVADADVATSPDGWVYVTSMWSPPTPLSTTPIIVEASPDGGETWTSSIIQTRRALLDIDRQWLVPGPDGFLMIVYRYSPGRESALDNPDAGMSVEAVVSQDHGASWSEAMPIVAPGPGREVLYGKPVLTNGVLVMPYFESIEDYASAPGTIKVAVSIDMGGAWQQVEVAPVRQSIDAVWPTQVAADDAGTLFLVWNERWDATIRLQMVSSTDAGRSWSAPQSVKGGGLDLLPWISAYGTGQVAVAWYGANATGETLEVDAATPWFAKVAVSQDSGSTWTQGVANAVPVKLGPLCAVGSLCPGNQDRELLDYAAVMYDDEGGLHVGYARSQGSGTSKIALAHYAQLQG